MNNSILNRMLEYITFKNMAHLIAGLATVAIISMDLGLDYTDGEKKIYTSMVFQILAILSVGYTLTEDIYQAIILLLVWLSIKYLSKSIENKKNN